MAWNSLVDTLLAGPKREREIKVEAQSEYEQWVSELYSELQVFVKRVNDLDLEEASDRDKLFSLIEQFAARFEDLRNRREAASAPADALITLEELIERMDNTATPIAATVAYLGDDPFEKARREKKEEEREKKEIERVRNERDEIAEYIRRVVDCSWRG